MRPLTPTLHLPGSGTDEELLAIWEKTVEQFPAPCYISAVTSLGRGRDGSDHGL